MFTTNGQTSTGKAREENPKLTVQSSQQSYHSSNGSTSAGGFGFSIPSGSSGFNTNKENITSSKHDQTFGKNLSQNGSFNSSNNSRIGLGKTPVKKLVIKSFKVKPKLPENYESDTWEKLKGAVKAVHESQPVPDSLEELYKACENLCHHKMANSLYRKLKAECESHVVEELGKLKNNITTNEIFLAAVDNCWKNHCRQMIMIRSIFLYLDRTYVLQTSGLSSLWDMGLDLYRDYVMESKEIRKKTLDGLLGLIEKERSGESINRAILKSLLRMFIDLGIYFSGFESAFLESTELFYRKESDTRAHGLEVSSYLLYVEQKLQEEKDRTLHYLDKETRKPLIELIERELIARPVSLLLEKGFDGLVANDQKEDLSRLYSLLARVGHLNQLKTFFGVYVKKAGLEIVTDVSRDNTMVQDLLNFKLKLDGILATSFQQNESFFNTLKESFESFINVRQNKPAEMIAKFVDSKLRTGNKTATDEELESILDNVLILFRFIQGKDVFEAFYKRDLAKRLLLNKSASFDAEKSMLSKLKTECGASFTSKLEGMFKDMDVSRDIMISFRQTQKYQELCKDIELNVSVLTQGYWPTYTPTEITLPEQMTEYQEVFKAFYLSKHHGRRLMWQHSLGHCVLKAYFPKGKKELAVSLYQAMVLLLFNSMEIDAKLSYKEISAATNIELKELERTLQSLACGKVRVLTKYPKGREIAETDSFSFNKDFTAPLFRIKVNAIQMKETVEENTNTTERVFQDRQYQVDAAIVRIMKTRKQLSHTLLMNELFEQLRFPVKASDLKKRIESLIDREYLERDKTDTSVYNYLA
ncbi:ubiquitin-protein ligase, cullin 4 [Basidiobolus meristosporus CBS 931.73]|uniref:Cullin-4 n=1 Tax=Basidiobolus meristosporus CBS 931.73 TaxID=1314790 RepID=A0A1Y1Y0T4_9FUNG|nr:ubiquitin-protein ligase, cullin 4 [Basidiobolus meristosporus CBS 931.73]|eukprot:ORX91617.1 ubiquitin-protein ligase, cullin 4 [Basidiobolus meristosporus CBS 931.73]